MTSIPTTISAEAQRMYAELRPELLPAQLTPDAAERMRAQNEPLRREMLDPLMRTIVESAKTEAVAGVPVVVVTPKQGRNLDEGKLALYIHGGAYCFGAALNPCAALMADLLAIRVHSIDYRLAPEHPFPSGLDDCMAVYRAGIERHDARDIVIFADSAGGGMALKLLLRARDAGLPLPAGAALMSPWCDLTPIGDSFAANEGRDAVITWAHQLEPCVRAYAGGADPASPPLSPLYADFDASFPPTMITTGTRDLFLSNCVRLDRVLRRAGVDVRTIVWEGMWHDFDAAPRCPEGAESRREIASFLLRRLGLPTA